MSDPSLFSANGMRLFFICCLLTVITNFPSGFSHTSINTAVHKMDDYLNNSFAERFRPLQHDEVSLIKSGINSGWYAGQVIGAMASPFVCDTYGRRVAFVISIAMMSLASGLQTLATYSPYHEIMIFGRLVAAVFSPLSDAALILYLQEISPASLRGTMSSLYSTGYSSMCLLGMLMGHKAILGHSLTVLFFVPVIPGVLSCVFLCLMPETPKFLMLAKKNKDGALASLRFFQGYWPDQALLLDGMQRRDETPATPTVTNTNSAVDEENQKSDLITLFRESHLRKAVFLSVAALTLTLGFYPILQSSTFFFTDMGVSLEKAQLFSGMMMVVLVGSSIVSTTLIDRLPRRLMLLSCGMMSIFWMCSYVLTAYMKLKIFAVASFFGFVMFFGLGIGPVVWSIPPELSPLQHRSKMFCLTYSIHSILIVVTNFSVIPLYLSIGPLAFVFLYAIPSIIAVIYLFVMLPETKGRQIHHIINELKGISPLKKPEISTIA